MNTVATVKEPRLTPGTLIRFDAWKWRDHFGTQSVAFKNVSWNVSWNGVQIAATEWCTVGRINDGDTVVVLAALDSFWLIAGSGVMGWITNLTGMSIVTGTQEINVE